MDEIYYEKRVSSILSGREGHEEQYSSISEFKQHSKDADLAEEKLVVGWVLWRETESYQQQYFDPFHSNNATQLRQKIITLLKHIASDWRVGYYYNRLVQFWEATKVEGRHHYLSTTHQPFCVPNLKKGLSRYRKVCKSRVYIVDMEGAEAEQLGSVGRAYRNKQPESTPDLRLYSINEFPLRDEAARCGFRGYMALPIFDLHKNECYGVLELLCHHPIMDEHKLRSLLDQGLQIAGLRSTHMSCFTTTHMHDKYEQPDNEIMEILELAIKVVPRLSLAQAWIPCKQCANLCCMERASFITTLDRTAINSCDEIFDNDMTYYLRACEFHNQQLDLTCYLRNISDLSISKSPLVHYAKKARLSHCFAICLQSMNNSNDFVIVEFFLQLKYREDACGDSSLHLLLRIFEMKLKIFKFVSIEQLPEELLVPSRQPNAVECESIHLLNVMYSYKEKFSESDFTTYLETVDSCCLRPSSVDSEGGWVFCSPVGEKLSENHVESNLSFVPTSIKEKIKQFMKKMAVQFKRKYWIVQFWAPKMAEDRCYLETSDQPYAVGCLAKGLASFRKECIKHHYFVDRETKEEELGPPGRVFRNGHPEITSDLFLYSTKEFSMRNYAVHCGLEGYFALPVFDKQEHKCVGVLEFIGYSYDLYEREIERALKAENMYSSLIDFHRRFRSTDNTPINITKAWTEVQYAFSLISEIPQLYLAKAWVSFECASINNNARCMELALTTEDMWEHQYANMVHWIIYVHPKKGMIGMVLESENKACFCRNLSEFSVVDQPLAHIEREERLDVCFAICLQSSHTGDLLYVIEFFLYQGPATYEYICLFFNFLLPVMKHELKSFKVATGKQLGEELVVEVIEFSDQLTSSKSFQLGEFPITFKSVQYGQKEHQYTEDQQVLPNSKVRRRKQHNAAASNLKKTEKGKKKTNLHLSLDVLEPHYGKKLKDVEEELGVGRSTIKRACRDYGIDRWPGNQKQARNPSLFQRESSRDPQQDMRPSSSSSLQEKVMIKVKYEEDTIKFELCRSVGVSRLFEEVTRRLNLKIGTFKLKYMDEDNEEILITSDDDLQLCPKSQTATGNTCIQLFVPQ